MYRVGQYLPVPVPDVSTAGVDTRVTSGVPLQVGIANVVTVSLKGENQYAGNASCDLGGVHLLPVTITGGPKSFGTTVYMTTATGLLTVDATGGVKFGFLAEESPVGNAVQTPCIVKITN